MMRIRPIPTSVTLLMLAIVLAAPIVTGWFTSHAQTPPKSYCSAAICADAAHATKSEFSLGPDFGVHYFTMSDNSSAGVYVGGYPQRPDASVYKTVETIDGIACDRYNKAAGSDGARQIAVYCKWPQRQDDSWTVIHAWASTTADPEKSEAMALLRSLKRCAETDCPWPKR